MVKPVDSSGSKGISRAGTREEAAAAYQSAKSFSRSKRVIFEEVIESPYDQLHGDGFVYNGELIFLELGDQRFKECVPIGSSCPTKMDPSVVQAAVQSVAGLIREVGFVTGGINVEIRVTREGRIYIIEIGPRTGGNYIPQLMEHTTGFDEMTASLLAALGEYRKPSRLELHRKPCFQYIIGAPRDGFFQEIWLSAYIKTRVRKIYVHKKKNDLVREYHNSQGVVGVAIMEYESMEEMENSIRNITDHIKVLLEEKI